MQRTVMSGCWPVDLQSAAAAMVRWRWGSADMLACEL